ncbi:MAG: hypothetical protein LBK73_07205 [Treponema sp.]|nr:hypothetical protein [Treponema sp.]
MEHVRWRSGQNPARLIEHVIPVVASRNSYGNVTPARRVRAAKQAEGGATF